MKITKSTYKQAKKLIDSYKDAQEIIELYEEQHKDELLNEYRARGGRKSSIWQQRRD